MTRVECPSCHGEGHHGYEEGSGLPYACFRCGMTGSVDAPHGVCRVCGDALLEGEGAALDGKCAACEVEELGCHMARSELAGLLEG